MGFPFIPAKNLDVPEIPYKDKVSLPAAKTALIVGDMQNDFVNPGGKLVVPAASSSRPD